MIDYVIEHNTDARVLEKAANILQRGGLIAFPTDTNWVMACDPFQKEGVEKLYRIRHVQDTKHLTVLCSNFQKAMEIAFIDDNAFSLMKKVIPGPYTFIFEAQKKITKHLKASRIDHQVGLRFPPKTLCRNIMDAYGDVLLSSHLSQDMIEEADPNMPLYGALIEDHFGYLIDLILDPGEYEFKGPTTIVDFTSGAPELIREGAGNPKIFIR